MKKTIIAIIITLLISVASYAQQGINYKALIKDDNGNIVTNQEVRLRFTILDALTGGTILYQGTHNSLMTDANGIIIATLGAGLQDLAYTFFHDLDWGNNEHYLQVEIDITGGTDYEDMGTTQFMAVPYAKYADTAGNVFSGDYNDLSNQPLTIPTGLEQVTENGKTGWRLIGSDPNYHTNIGVGAIDLTNDDSDFSGASGNFSMAIGNGTNAYDDYSLVIGSYNAHNGLLVVGNGYFLEPSSAFVVKNNGEIIAPSLSPGLIEIAGDKALITKEYADSNYLIDGGNVVSNNIGIGRDTPSSLLEVAHQDGAPTSANRTNAFSIRNLGTGRSWQMYTEDNGYLLLFNDGNYRGSFNASSGAYGQISDKRLKKDITALQNDTLNKVMQLNPVSYLMKGQKDTKRNLGLISQEVQELFPSITYYVEESDLLALSYTELIPVLIKALQEQQEIIETQNSENIQQNQAIQSLLQRMNVLEAVNNGNDSGSED